MENNELMHYGVKGMKWGHRKNYYGSSGDKYRASNGVTVGAPKNAGVAAFRKVQGSKAGGAAIKGIAKANTAIYGRGKNKASMKRIEERTRKETDAVREANQAHKQAKAKLKAEVKAEKKQFKKDVKNYKKNIGVIDIQGDKDGNLLITSRTSTLHNSLVAKKGKAYADKVVNTYEKQQKRKTVAMLAGGAALMLGSAYVDSLMSN